MRVFLSVALLTLVFLLAACGAPQGSSVSGACPAVNTVKTDATAFEQPCVTIQKGSTLTIVPAEISYHTLAYGLWNGSTAQPQTTPDGAPSLGDAVVNSQDVSIGPFMTAGTYRIYCTVHPGMELTIIVS